MLVALFRVLMLSGFLLLPCPAFSDSQGDIIVHVAGVNNDRGVLRIALFNSAASYSADKNTAEGAFRKAVSEIKQGESTYTFRNVPYGQYAIKLFHDEDNSGKFLTGLLGMPKVQYGFSNNARGMLGPASFDKATFSLEQADLKLDISMQGR